MVLGDTDRCPVDRGTFGSLTTRMFGPVLRAAAAQARAELVALAAQKLRVAPERLTVTDGVVSVAGQPGRSVSYGALSKGAKIARTIDGQAILRAASEFQVMGHSPARLDGREKVTGAAKYAADNIATIWVTTAKAVWLWVLPGLRLRARSFDGDNDVKDGDSGNDVATGAATMDIIDGVAAFREHSLGNPEGATSDVEVIRRWEQLADATLDATVSAILGGTMVVHRVTWLNEQTPFAGKSDEDMHVNALVSKSDVRAESQYSGSEGLYEVVRKRRRALARASRTPRPVGPVAPVPARRSKNTNPMGERQERVLRSALPEVLALAMSGEHVWVGVPPMPLTNGGAAGGDASSAYGLPLWIGTEVDEARLVAVLSPVARLITDEVAHRWLDECVRVYVESEVEGSVLSRALGWPMGDLYLRHSKAL